MDSQRQANVVDTGRDARMGVAGGRPCTTCGVIVHWRIEKFCLSQPTRFGGRIYCIRCQAPFPASSPTP